IDSLGNIVWTKTYGGDGNDWLLSSESIKKTNDNGYIIVGTTISFGTGARDIYLIKTDSIGNIQWTKTFGGTEFDDGWAVQQTTDGGYIIAGMTNSFGAGNTDAYLIKTDAIGDTIWTRTYGGSNWDDARAVLQTSDGGYIFTGHTESFGYGCDFYVVKTNSAGDTLWTKSYHPNIGGAEGNAIQNTSDSGYIIAGYTTTPTNEGDIFLIKIDSLGTLLWNKTVGGLWEEDAYSIKQTGDSGYIIVGMTLPYGAENFDLYLVKIGPDIGGVEELKKSINTAFNIFPNPARELFTLQSHIPLKKIKIFNAAGQLEQEFIFNNHSILNTKISTTSLKSGVYFIQIYAEDIHQIKKLIIIR
ncbi:MAG: T9SS type A sorting domain-containing protein, partial [candidate division WOR-3 bacterium]